MSAVGFLMSHISLRQEALVLIIVTELLLVGQATLFFLVLHNSAQQTNSA